MHDPYYYPQYPSYVVNPPKTTPMSHYSPSILFSTDNNYWPAGSDSLEAMVHDTKMYGLDVTDLIMQDKTRMASTAARLLRHQIDKRTNLMEENLGYLDHKILECGSYLHQMDGLPYFANKHIESRRSTLMNEITRLEAEKRREVVSAWSDKVRLYGELMKTLDDYQAVIRRSQLISGE